MVDKVKPTMKKEIGYKEGGCELNHPAFGCIQVDRVSSSHGINMFDSELKHKSFITLRINTASLSMGSYYDSLNNGQTIIEVDMTENQWATMVSNLNGGIGTPCTIKKTPANITPIKRLPMIDPIDKVSFKIDQHEKYIDSLAFESSKILDSIDSMLDGKSIKKTEVKDLRSKIAEFCINVPSNMRFAKEQFKEYADEVMVDAKSSISGHVAHTVQKIGLDRINEFEIPVESSIGSIDGEVKSKVGDKDG